jgi:hypothetical protein
MPLEINRKDERLLFKFSLPMKKYEGRHNNSHYKQQMNEQTCTKNKKSYGPINDEKQGS